ncbi:MAG: tRNA 2-thiouridine(34) synthase MnmA [Patescibacteria group bacterium]
MAKAVKKPTVLVGMSGGVDSSVAALLLKKKGFDVIGGFIKNWSDTKDLATGECAWLGERRDAMRVAARLGIPLVTFDFEKTYRSKVVKDLFRGYAAGETPNPDVLCNEYIKFGLFAEQMDKVGAQFVATGHYARVKRDTFGAHLLRGLDPGKDQSYFLYRVPQAVLRRTLFPVGALKKSAVRKIAREAQLPVARKPDSQGICFIGKLDMVQFLRKKIPSKPGDIVDEFGKILGRHQGLDAYTIGQRQRIMVTQGVRPWYVADKDLKRNRLIVVQGAQNPRLFRDTAELRDLKWMSGEKPTKPFKCLVQTRYRQEAERAVCWPTNKLTRLVFVAPAKGMASGQSAVLYRGNECLGGGVIAKTYDAKKSERK